MSNTVSIQIDPARMDQVESTWKEIRETIIQKGSLTKESGSVASITYLSTQLGIDINEPTWAASLELILTEAFTYQKPSVRVAAAGIARSLRTVGIWGQVLSVDAVADKEKCQKVRDIAGRILRGTSTNLILKWADWLQEKVTSKLVNDGCLPRRYQEAVGVTPETEDFDAVQEYSLSGVREELPSVSKKITEMVPKIGLWKSFLLKVEHFLSNVIGSNISKIDAVAGLQARWRIIAAKVEELLQNEDPLSESQDKKLKGYAFQFNWTKRSLTRYAKENVWEHGDDAFPFLHIKKGKNAVAPLEQIAARTQKKLIDLGIITTADLLVFVES